MERGPTFVREDEPRRETEQKPSEMQVRNQKCVVSWKSVRKQYHPPAGYTDTRRNQQSRNTLHLAW